MDGFGPQNLQPRSGHGWFAARQSRRLRTTYRRIQGVRHMFGALDLRARQLYYRTRDRKPVRLSSTISRLDRGGCERGVVDDAARAAQEVNRSGSTRSFLATDHSKLLTLWRCGRAGIGLPVVAEDGDVVALGGILG